MDIEGYIYYQGVNYDNDGHCDDYDLMFRRCDTGEELCLNGYDEAIFPQYYNKDGGISPISTSDKILGKLTLSFKQTEPTKQGVTI